MNLTQIIPHRAPMVLIDEVIDSQPTQLIAGVKIQEKSFGCEGGEVPAWFGVEYMAQAIAAFNGLNLSKTAIHNKEPEIGFLVGVRGYKSSVESFKLGDQLVVRVCPDLIIDSSGSFKCEIKIGEDVIAEATITTYKPDNEFIDKLKEESREQ